MAEQKKMGLPNTIRDFLFLLGGVGMASIGLKGFLLPNDFLDGGAMGVSLLLEIITRVDLSLLIILVNLPFIVISAKQISLKFAIKSTCAIFLLAILVHVIHFPTITNDKLLISVFGGFFLGAGIGLTMRGGAVIDGTEVLAITVSRKYGLSVGDFIALFNVVLFSLAAFILNVETAMYSMLTYFAASKTIDFILNGIEEYIGVTIVSDHAEAIKAKITHEMARGVTVFKGESGFQNVNQKPTDKKILMCVITRLEITKLLRAIEKIDPKAFVIQHSVRETKGGMIRRRPLH